MSFFETAMLVCFGSAWPFALYKSYTSRSNGGKSLLFLFVVLAGYASGIAHKFRHNFDGVIYLYALNALMVAADIALYYRNARAARVS
ncbi:MAG: hypothetical protein ACYC5N_01110 [Endomicrobiales bacterium]